MYAAGHHNAEPGLLTTARNPTRRKLEWIALFAVVVIGGASAFFVSTNSTARSTDEAKKNAAPMTLEFVPNNFATVALQPLVRTSAISGSLSPLSEAIVRATVAGEVHSTSMCSRWDGGKLAKHAVELGARVDVSGLTDGSSGLSQGADVVRARMGCLNRPESQLGFPAIALRASRKYDTGRPPNRLQKINGGST